MAMLLPVTSMFLPERIVVSIIEAGSIQAAVVLLYLKTEIDTTIKHNPRNNKATIRKQGKANTNKYNLDNSQATSAGS